MVALTEITRIQAPQQRCFDLARSVEVHLAGNVHWGESAIALPGAPKLLALRDQVTWRAKHRTATSTPKATTLPFSAAPHDRPPGASSPGTPEPPAPGLAPWTAPTSASTSPAAASTAATPQPTAEPFTIRASRAHCFSTT